MTFTTSRCRKVVHVGLAHSPGDAKSVDSPGGTSLDSFFWEWQASQTIKQGGCRKLRCAHPGVQDTSPKITNLGKQPSLPQGPTAPPKGARKLVKDECQELICCQTKRESTDGSTLLVANLVVV